MGPDGNTGDRGRSHVLGPPRGCGVLAQAPSLCRQCGLPWVLGRAEYAWQRPGTVLVAQVFATVSTIARVAMSRGLRRLERLVVNPISPRLLAIVDALPIRPGMRVLEIGCGPGVAAREIVQRHRGVHVLGIDRSARAVAQAVAGSAAPMAQGRLAFRTVAAEDFVLLPGEAAFDLAFAVRVGALDGRHPAQGRLAMTRIAAALKPGGRCFIDGGDPLRELALPR